MSATDYILPPVPAGLSVPVGCERIAREYGERCAEAFEYAEQVEILRAEVEALRTEHERNRRLLYGFMLDCNTIGPHCAGENLARGIKASVAAQRGEGETTE